MVANADARPPLSQPPLSQPPLSQHQVPLYVLTGFLGSGKTTLLAALLRAPPRRDGRPERIAVLVNELADLALDQHLLERVDDEVLALASGCLCCELRGELHRAVARLARRRPDRIVVETTGLADPAPLLQGFLGGGQTAGDQAGPVRPAGVIAVVDVLRAEELSASQPEFRRQLEFADRIVLTKGDLAPERRPAVHALLAELAPGCAVREARDGRIDPDWLLDAAPLAGLDRTATSDRWLHGAGAGPDARSASLELEAPADIDALQLWVELVTQLDGPRLLRFKALARCRATGAVFALQAAGRSVSPPRRLERPPAQLPGLQAVLIHRGLDADTVAGMLAALGAAAAGRPWTAPAPIGQGRLPT